MANSCWQIGPLHDPVTWYKITRMHSGTFKTKQLVPVLLDPPLFWKFHCATCIPACLILYHVTESCKGPITGVFQAFSKLARSAKNGGRRTKPFSPFFRFNVFWCCLEEANKLSANDTGLTNYPRMIRAPLPDLGRNVGYV